MANFGKRYAELILNIVLSTAAMLESLGEEYLEGRHEGKKWNKKQILGHLIDSAYNNQIRIVDNLLHDEMLFRGYDQDLWVQLNQYAYRNAQEILESFVVIQRHIAQLIAGIDDEILTKKFKIHNLNEVTMQSFPSSEGGCLSFLIWDYIFHLEHHLNQIIPGYQRVNVSEYYG